MSPKSRRLAIAANVEALPDVPRGDIGNLVTGGIVNAQGGYQNDPSTVLGYPVPRRVSGPRKPHPVESIPPRQE